MFWIQPQFIPFQHRDNFRNDEYQIISQFKKCFVAGGHALRCYTNADWEDDRDIDVFFYDQSKEEWRAQLKNIRSNGWDTTLIGWNTIIDVAKLRKHDYNRRIDLIYAGKYKDPITLLEDFDLDICSIGFKIKADPSGYHFFYIHRFQECLSNKVCNVYYDPKITKDPFQNHITNPFPLELGCTMDDTLLVWNVRLKDRINIQKEVFIFNPFQYHIVQNTYPIKVKKKDANGTIYMIIIINH